jgi:hypothetical protein
MQNDEVVVESNEPAAVAEETKAEVIVEGEAKEGDKPEATETPEQAEAKKQSKFQRRLERQKTARIAAETETRILRERIAALEAERAPKQQDAAPKRDDYPDDVQYLEALTDYKADQKVKAALSERDKQQEGRQHQSKAQEADAKVAETWKKHEATFKATNADYEETVTPFVEDELQQYSQGAKRAIVESDVGPQLLYHLATHQDDAERISGMSPLQQIKELGKLEDKMARPAKRTSNAPPPPNPVKGGTSGSKDPAKMNMAEYTKWMADNGSKWVRKAA